MLHAVGQTHKQLIHEGETHLLSSYRAMSFPSSQWPAREAASLEMPSMLQPSPRITYLHTRDHYLSEMAAEHASAIIEHAIS